MKTRKMKLLPCCVMLCVFTLSNTAFAASATATVTASRLNIRKGAGTSYAILSSAPSGSKVTVKSTEKGWSKITYNGITGYVSANYLSSTVSSSSSATLRRGDSGSDVKQLQNDLKELNYFSATSTGYFGSITENAVEDFQQANDLSVDGIAGKLTLGEIEDALENGETAGTKGNTNITLKMGSTGSNVTDLQKALKEQGYMNVSPTGYYGSITRSAVIKYQSEHGLSVDGIAGPKTLTALYNKQAKTSSSSAKNGKVEKADWWTVVSKVFARGEIATVTDVKTGLSYQVKRHGGTNHADVEPLTASDTAILKKIYGGSWSWSRRAAWVDVDGRRFAASINGMPHGNGSLSYNNFSGHSCIHFLNSRTHGTNKVDADHQAAIETAYKKG